MLSLPDFSEPSVALYFAVLVLVVALSIWRGGAPEKSGALFVLSTILIQSIAYASVSPRFGEVDTVALLVDSILFFGFGAIALNARRIWPLFAAGLQLISLSAHFARQVEDNVIALAYATMKVVPTSAVLLLLVLGTLLHQRRLKLSEKDLSWTDFELWRELPGRQSQQYVDEHRLAFSRAWLGTPVAICGLLVIGYCAAAFILPETPEIAIGTVSTLAVIGTSAMIAGTWLHIRETGDHNARVEAFREKWRAGVPEPADAKP